ncbi:MAG: relaxase domain-containing protein [Gammaproteobacteria bacterium]|nr:relaxase domain-containing protein [Gammaproteobacteria bacterium]
MLTVYPMGKAGDGASDYYTNLAVEDYYKKGGEPPGRWHNHHQLSGLGLTNTLVTDDTLRSVLAGFHPITQAALTKNAGPEHFAGWDMTFSAPKSVSVVWAQADTDLRHSIQRVQDLAVERTLAFVEEHVAKTPRGAQGNEKEAVQRLIVAKFEHSTSRAQDPQLHTHCLVANIAQRFDGSWGCLEGRPFFQWKMALGAMYRAELADLLQTQLGLQVEQDSGSFRVKLVPKSVELEFSQRRVSIVNELEARGWTTAQGAQMISSATRERKAMVDRPQLFAQWQDRGRGLGFGPDEVARLFNPERRFAGNAVSISSVVPPREALKQLTEKRSTFLERDVFRLVAEKSQGVQSLASVKRDAIKILSHPDVVILSRTDGSRVEIQYSTTDMMELEKSMVQSAVKRQSDSNHRINPSVVAKAIASVQQNKGFELTSEQVRAVRGVCSESGGVVCIRGDAGTGKSTAMEAVRVAFESAGYRVVGNALQGKASTELSKSSGIKSQTLHSFLGDINRGDLQLGARTVVVLDEAGMVGSRQMSDLIRETENAGAKLLLVGDNKQLQPILAGGAFKAITNELGAFPVTEIMRQKNDWAKQAVTHFSQGDIAKAMGMYFERGRLHIMDNAVDSKLRLVSDWMEARQQRPDHSLCMIANTRAQVNDLNALARYRLKELGQLVNGTQVSTPGGDMELCVGDRLMTTRNSKYYKVANGTLATVAGLHTPSNERYWSVTLKLDSGRRQRMMLKDYNKFEYGYASTTHKSQGSTVHESFILISEDSMLNRELAYVANSRHTHDSHIYVDRESVQSFMEELRPTPGMLDYARDLAQTKHLELPSGYETSFMITREFLNQHSQKTLDYEQVAPELKELEGLFHAMKQSHQKDTTLDYDQRPGTYEYPEGLSPALPTSVDSPDSRAPLAYIFYEAERLARETGFDLTPGDAREAIKYLYDNGAIDRDTLYGKALECHRAAGDYLIDNEFDQFNLHHQSALDMIRYVGQMDAGAIALRQTNPNTLDLPDALTNSWEQGRQAYVRAQEPEPQFSR